MPLNGSGVASPPGANYPAVALTLITAANRNGVDADIYTILSTALYKDGQQTPTANIPLGGFKLTGVGAATARTDAATLATIQDGTGVYVGTVGGTADVITLTVSPAITAYAAGQTFRWIASGANTTNVTVNVSGLGAKAVTKNGTTALVAGDIPSGTLVEASYDGTRFILGTNGAASAPGGPFVDTNPVVVGSVDATKKIRFEVDGLTTATTRVVTVLDADFTIGAATQAEQETGTALTVAVTPGRQHFHPSAAKFFVSWDNTGGIQGNAYNVTSVTDNGAGLFVVNVATDFSSVAWVGHFDAIMSDGLLRIPYIAGIAAGTLTCRVRDLADSGYVDATGPYFASGFGDQA